MCASPTPAAVVATGQWENSQEMVFGRSPARPMKLASTLHLAAICVCHRASLIALLLCKQHTVAATVALPVLARDDHCSPLGKQLDQSQDTPVHTTCPPIPSPTRPCVCRLHAAQVLPNNPAQPPEAYIYNRTDFWSIMRTTAGWIAVGRLEKSQDSAIFQSSNGISWSSIPIYTFADGGRASLWQALQNNPQEAVVLATVELRDTDKWLDIFRSNDGGRSFKELGILAGDAAKVSLTAAALFPAIL